MQDVAQLAGVSMSTVSRALRGSALVSPETTARVQAAAAELSFSISRAASSLATGKLNRVAVLVSGSLGAWFNGTLLDSVYATLHQAGQEMLIYRTLDADQRDEFFAALPARRNADALIVASLELTAGQHQRLHELGLPLVYVNQRVEGSAAVSIDDAAGAVTATRYLINLGHRRIAFVGWQHTDGTHLSSADRRSGYQQAMTGCGIAESEHLVITARRPDEGKFVVAELLGSSRPPTALVVESDELAMSVLASLAQEGVRVPDGVSVIGFDGHALSDKFGLSTMAQPVEELGRQSAELALAMVGDQQDGAAAVGRPTRLLPTRLVLRTSTGPPLS